MECFHPAQLLPAGWFLIRKDRTKEGRAAVVFRLSLMHLPKPQRQPELDALRGLFLVWMTLTHLPTRFSDFVNQPIGYVSSAEGFVFLSAMLVGRVSMRKALEDGAALRATLWKRSLRIYAYHLLMLALAFTVAAAYAVRTHRAAIYNLLDFYIAHPVVAVAGSVLLLYCPPLLDILPMYVIFLFFSPLVLTWAVRRGWGWILAGSMTFWLFAQFGLRDAVHNVIVHLTHLPIPLQETGAFNLFAWQAVWIAGLWLGSKSALGEMPLRRIPGQVVAVCAVVCLFFIGVRHSWLGPHLTQQALGMKLDKWQIGPLRVMNLVTFTVVFYWLRKYVLRLVAIEPFLTLGKASLHVFCAHVFFVFVGLALLVNDVPELHGWPAVILLAGTFSGLILVAVREVRNQRAKKRRLEQEKQRKQQAAPVFH
ncbi:MAG: OpgC domain-containing protein [Acidobacterium ailaaui]|nr:OpgC domain-containing protein [Pseudacidobacterium ailaaui]